MKFEEHFPVISQSIAALLALAISGSCWSATPWGEKDEGDVLKEARTYHIMFSTERDAQIVHRKLEGRKGKDLLNEFRKLAKIHSKDPGSAPAGGDLGMVREGEMVKTFERALFELAPMTVSAPVKSEFGWHLIYATDFQETTVSEICESSLSDSIRRAKGDEKEKLRETVMLAPYDSAAFAERISDALGPSWGAPLKDWHGNLAFLNATRTPEPIEVGSAVLHTEYFKAIFSNSPKACKRSARSEFEVNCKTRVATPTKRTEYEGRLALGRVLNTVQTNAAEKTKQTSGAGFFGQVVTAVCGDQK